MPTCSSPECDCNKPWTRRRHPPASKRLEERHLRGQMRTIWQIVRSGGPHLELKDGRWWASSGGHASPIVVGHGHVSVRISDQDRKCVSSRWVAGIVQAVRQGDSWFRESVVQDVMTS